VPESVPTSAPLRRRITRRTTLAAAAPLLALAGCRWGPAEEIDGAREAQEDADAALAETAATAIGQQLAALRLDADAHRGLAGALAPLIALHTAHLGLLPTVEVLPEGTGSPSSTKAWARMQRAETRLQQQLADIAVSATSGTFARALASMSAAIAQHLADLPPLANRGPA
jgi:hypothetical protein